MEAQDATQLLAQLRDIHLPPAPAEPSLWPLLLAAILIAVALFTLLYRHLKKNNSWAATATRELRKIQSDANPAALLQTAELIKRIVITHDSNPGIRHLTGTAWLAYLDKFFSTTFFSSGHGQLFGNALYQQQDHRINPGTYATLEKLIRRRKWQND